jgi:UMF1 family MFS transporter
VTAIAPDTPAPVPKDVPKVVWSWALYDFANSAFTTLVVTFIYATYFTKAMAPDEIIGTAWWSRGIAVSAILIAILSPLMGAIADQGGARKRFLAVSTGVCVLTTAALAFIAPGDTGTAVLALTLFVVANIAFEMSSLFNSAFLPSIASPERIGRVSGYGWGLGYVGGLLCLVVALVGFVQPEVPWFGMTTEGGWNVRATNLLVAAWFLLFSLPMFLHVPERRATHAKVDVLGAFRGLAQTLRDVQRYREIVKFLAARLIYNDGLVTIFAFGGIYAAGTFGFTISEVILFGIVLNVASGIGAIAFGWVDDKLGGRNTILITLVALIIASLVAVLAPTRAWFWVAGVMVGIFVGPNQSASRSLMGRLVPEKHETEFFGFFAFSGKATAFLGPLLLGIVTKLFDSQRAGVATVIAFFAIGGVILLTVDEKRGMAGSER